MSNALTGVKAHDDTVAKAELVRQSVAPGSSQATYTSADVTFFRAVARSALANGVSPSAAMSALKALGQTGI
jgi:hypothetical protein